MRLKIKHVQQPGTVHRLDLGGASNPTLEQLRAAVVGALFPCSGAAAGDVQLSLNKKDVLAAGGGTSATTLGVCSGDLLWVLAPALEAAAARPPPPPPAAPAPEQLPASAGGAPMEVDQAGGATDPAADAVLQVVEPPPSQPWCPDVLLRLLAAAAVAAPSCSLPQQHELSAAQALVLAAHAAMLECGFVHNQPPTGSAQQQEQEQQEQLETLLQGQQGVFSAAYQLPGAACSAPPDHPGARGGSDPQSSTVVSVELRGIDMGRHLVLTGSLVTTAAAGAAGAGSRPACKLVATLNLAKERAQPGTPAAAAADPAAAMLCAYQDLPALWVALKDQLGLPLLVAACAAAGLPSPTGLNSLMYELQELILAGLQARDLAALCCSCSPLRHRASTDPLWQPLFEREFPTGPTPAAPAPAANQQQQQQQQQQQAVGSSELQRQLDVMLSHGQKLAWRQSLSNLRREAGRRGWKWAFGAAWSQRARVLADAERIRRQAHMPVRLPPHPSPMPWGPYRPAHPVMPSNIIGGDYDRFPSIGLMGGGSTGGAGSGGGLGFGAGLAAAGGGIGGGLGPGPLPGPGGLGGFGSSGGGRGLVGSGGALFSAGGGLGGGGAGMMPPGGVGGRGAGSSSNTRLY